jgi:hypothetical protein
VRALASATDCDCCVCNPNLPSAHTEISRHAYSAATALILIDTVHVLVRTGHVQCNTYLLLCPSTFRPIEFLVAYLSHLTPLPLPLHPLPSPTPHTHTYTQPRGLALPQVAALHTGQARELSKSSCSRIFNALCRAMMKLGTIEKVEEIGLL